MEQKNIKNSENEIKENVKEKHTKWQKENKELEKNAHK